MSSTDPTIVLVHGAWHGSWCWENVATQLRSDGFEVIAVDLPGHEATGSSKRKWNTMGSYVDHVATVVDAVDGRVVVVGHSMGGLVTQRLLENRNVQLGVLVASAPRKGVLALVTRLARHHPRQLFETLTSISLWPLVSSNERAAGHLFGASTDPLVVEAAGAKLQNESYVAFVSMLARWPRPSKVTSPVRVIAASNDAIFTLVEQHDLARAYGLAEAHVLDGAHDLMLEPVWPELATILSKWARADTP